MKTLIVYFTHGGTTDRMADVIADGLRRNGLTVDTCDIVEGTPPGLDGYDSLGVGFPVYVFRPPFIIINYLESLPDLKDIPVFTFTTHGTYQGDAGNRARKTLKSRGGREIGHLNTRGEDHYLGHPKLGYLFSPNRPDENQIDQAKSAW